MSDNLILEDGRVWWSENIVIASVLYEVACEVQANDIVFSNWLKDKNNRHHPL